MQKVLMFILLILTLGSIHAQEVKKELKTEEDGFQWYELTSGSFYGAESTDGKCLIPLSKKYDFVLYKPPYLSGLYHSDKPGIIYKTEYYTQDGKEILDNSKYDNTCLLGGKDGEPYWFSTEKDGKEGACDINGNEIVPPVFEACFYSDGEFTIKDNTGYHKWSEYNNQTNNAQASTNNKAASIKELFDLAYNTPDTEAQTKYDRYMQVIKADPYNSYGYKAPALNNLGVLYESLGDLNNAKACYEYALQACPTYDMAKQNLKSVKAQRRSKRWSTIGNILGTVGETLGTMSNSQAAGTYGTYQENGSSYSGSSSGSSTGSSMCKRCHGSGKCSSMSGTADKYYCHGSGKCGYCNGSGIVRNLGQNIVCTACNGRGKCSYCHGSGKCSDCGGSGKR